MADTSSTSAGKLTIGVEVNSSTVAADVAAVKAKAEAAATATPKAINHELEAVKQAKEFAKIAGAGSNVEKIGSDLGNVAKNAERAANAIGSASSGGLLGGLMGLMQSIPVFGQIAAAISAVVVGLVNWQKQLDAIRVKSILAKDEYDKIFAERAKQDVTKQSQTESLEKLAAMEKKYAEERLAISERTDLRSIERVKIYADLVESYNKERAQLEQKVALDAHVFQIALKDRRRFTDEENARQEILREKELRKAAALETDNEYARIEIQRFERNEELYKRLDKSVSQGQIDSINRQIALSNELAQKEIVLQRKEDDRKLRAARNEAAQRAQAEIAANDQIRKAQMQGFEAEGSTVFGAGAIPDLLRAIQYQGSVRQE